MINLNDNIEYLSKLLYEYLFEKNILTNNYKYENTSINDISLIKKSNNERIINMIFNTKINYRKTIKIDNIDIYIFKREHNINPVDIYIIKYHDNYEDNNININVDKIITYLLSDLVIYRYTKHILLTLMNIDISYKQINNFIEKYDELKNKLKMKDMLSISVHEHFKKIRNIKEDINKFKEEDYIILIFQILHTLTIIQQKYPKFRHNNLVLELIDYYYRKEDYNKYDIYMIDNNKFKIPITFFEIKISYFYKSVIIDTIDNNNISNELKSVDSFYDIYVFLKSLMNYELPNKIIEFCENIIGKNYDKYNKLLLTPKQILTTNDIFDKYRLI